MPVPGLVSIIIPAWKATWFEIALQSVLQQDYAACEIIIGDDSHNNEIARIVKKNSQLSRWPVYYQRNCPSLGEMANTSDCLDRAQGEYIKFLHDDDVLKPDCVSKLVAAINQHPDIVMATSHREMIDAKGRRLPDHEGTAPLFNRDSVLYGLDVINFQATKPLNFIGEPSVVLIRAAVLRAILAGGEPIFKLGGQSMPFLADLAIYLKVLRYGHLAMVTQTLSQYRISGSQTLSTVSEHADMVSATHRNMPLMLKKLGWHDPARKFGQIRVAPLTHPEQFSEQNLLQEIAASLASSRMKMWFDKRTLRPAQQKLLNEYLTTHVIASSCTLFIDARNGNREAWDITLDSLNAGVAGLSWQIIALTDEQVNYLPAETAQLRLDLTDGLAALNSLINQSESEWLLFLDAGCQLLPSGINVLSTTLLHASQYNAIYTDIIYPVVGKPMGTLFRPDFNLDLFLSCPDQMSRGWLFKREWIIAAGGVNPGCTEMFEFELQLRLIESANMDTIGHLTEPLLLTATAPATHHAVEQSLLLEHLQRRGFNQAEVLPTHQGPWHLKYHHQSKPLVTIAILARDFNSVSRCVMTVLESTDYQNYELLIVADKREDKERAAWLKGISSLGSERIRVVHYPAAWQRAGMANQAILDAQGNYLLFLNSDIHVMHPEWLDNMMNHAQRPEVAIVGAKQLYANNVIRHAGYILGINGSIAEEPFYGTDDGDNSYMKRLHAAQNYSAVSGDFMLVSKDLCYAVNGFDADLNDNDDIDFCLRVQQLGGIIVWTPYARGCRQPEKTLSGIPASPSKEEENIMLERWLTQISQDPAYNKNLSPSFPFALQNGDQHTWLPLSWHPLPVVISVTGDDERINVYRVKEPFSALRDAGIIEGKHISSLPTLPEVTNYNPDVIVVEPQIDENFNSWIAKLSRFNSAFKVGMINPTRLQKIITSSDEQQAGQNFIASIRSNLDYFDRLIVNNEKEAEIFSAWHSDILIMPTLLPEAQWRQLSSLHRQGKKPRIVLPGNLCHHEIQGIVARLIDAFADQVEWVIYGNCPPALRPMINIVIREADKGIYQKTLTEMHPDLALIPHNGHPLTYAEVYMHLIEYGACGIPLICSKSIVSGSDTFTITCVANEYADWHQAISAHLNDTDGSERMGRILQSEVRQRCLLNDDRMIKWSAAWCSN
ncbi:glycosyltransferase [Pantoea sp. UYEF8]|uniref:glycosyltransferase n=1 Tax=Pantoea sp. UYEF8 TaxID=1756394 RepID=UPI0033979E7A